jgi:hypothetical protein
MKWVTTNPILANLKKIINVKLVKVKVNWCARSVKGQATAICVLARVFVYGVQIYLPAITARIRKFV